MKKAEASGAQFCLNLGENQVDQENIAVTALRTSGEQTVVPWQQLSSHLQTIL